MRYTDLDARFRPLDVWPAWAGEKTKERIRSPYSAKWGTTLEDLKRELRALDAENIVLQLDIPATRIRNDGYPYQNATAATPGVILSFQSKHGPLRYSADLYTDWESNLRAIALTMQALRSVDRWGVLKRGEQYTGQRALPASTQPVMSTEQAARVVADLAYRVGGGPHAYGAAERILADRDEMRARYREAAVSAHPDAGGSTDEFQRLQEAKRILDAHHGT